MTKIFMRALNTTNLPNKEVNFYFDLLDIWLQFNFHDADPEELYNDFNDFLKLREGIKPKKLFDLIIMDEDAPTKIKKLAVKYPIQGVCCRELIGEITELEIHKMLIKEKYLLIFEGEPLNVCYNFDDVPLSFIYTLTLAKPTKTLQIFSKKGDDIVEIEPR